MRWVGVGWCGLARVDAQKFRKLNFWLYGLGMVLFELDSMNIGGITMKERV